jgi:phytoene synthase
VYREIGMEVKRRGARAWDTRAGTSRATKLRLLALGGVDALASRFRKPGARPTGLWHAARHRATHAVGA